MHEVTMRTSLIRQAAGTRQDGRQVVCGKAFLQFERNFSISPPSLFEVSSSCAAEKVGSSNMLQMSCSVLLVELRLRPREEWAFVIQALGFRQGVRLQCRPPRRRRRGNRGGRRPRGIRVQPGNRTRKGFENID